MNVPLGREHPWVDATGRRADTLYDLVGPEWFVALVDRFYAVSYTHLRAHETLR